MLTRALHTIVTAPKPVRGPSFNDLTLDNYDVDEGAAALVGNILGGLGAPYQVELFAQEEADWFYADEALEAGGAQDYETNPSPTVTLREWNPDAGGTLAAPTGLYHDTVIEITVNDVSEGPSYGPECVTNGNPFGAGWTLTGTDGDPPVISGGLLTFSDSGFDTAFAQRASTQTLTAGDYNVRVTVDSIAGSAVNASVGGTGGIGRDAPGAYEETITIAASNQNVRLQDAAGDSGAVISFYSVRRIL